MKDMIGWYKYPLYQYKYDFGMIESDRLAILSSDIYSMLLVRYRNELAWLNDNVSDFNYRLQIDEDKNNRQFNANLLFLNESDLVIFKLAHDR